MVIHPRITVRGGQNPAYRPSAQILSPLRSKQVSTCERAMPSWFALFQIHPPEALSAGQIATQTGKTTTLWRIPARYARKAKGLRGTRAI